MRPKHFFQPVIPISLSNESKRLKALPYYTWLFQLIEIYQSRDYFKSGTNCWIFIKGDNNVKAICRDLQGNILACLSNCIFDQHSYFEDLTLYVSDGKCMIEEEYLSTCQFVMTA